MKSQRQTKLSATIVTNRKKGFSNLCLFLNAECKEFRAVFTNMTLMSLPLRPGKTCQISISIFWKCYWGRSDLLSLFNERLSADSRAHHWRHRLIWKQNWALIVCLWVSQGNILTAHSQASPWQVNDPKLKLVFCLKSAAETEAQGVSVSFPGLSDRLHLVQPILSSSDICGRF